MAINKPGFSGGVMSAGLMSTKPVAMAKGYAAGGPAGAVMASNPNSAFSKGLSLYNTGKNAADMVSGGPADAPTVPVASTEESAMTRYMAKPKTPEDQLQAVNMGIYALNSAPPEVRDEYAPSLFRTQIALERQMGKRR